MKLSLKKITALALTVMAGASVFAAPKQQKNNFCYEPRRRKRNSWSIH